MLDVRAFTRLYQEYNKRIYRYALGMSRDILLAMDLTQEAFRHVWDARDRLNDRQHAVNSLYLMVRRLYTQYCRKARVWEKVVPGLSTLAEEAIELPDDLAVITEETYAALEAAVAKLSPQRRLVLDLLYREDLDTRAIARRLQLSVQTIRNHKTQTIDWLRNELKKKLFFE
jgi:RNA polymerase sigma-70 factor (ECF subfamily)